MENSLEKSKEEVSLLYEDLKDAARMNPELYVMPLELYNRIMKRMGHIEDRIKKQTESLKRHREDKKALNERIRELELLLQVFSREHPVLCPICEDPIDIADAIVTIGLVRGKRIFHKKCSLEKEKEKKEAKKNA